MDDDIYFADTKNISMVPFYSFYFSRCEIQKKNILNRKKKEILNKQKMEILNKQKKGNIKYME